MEDVFDSQQEVFSLHRKLLRYFQDIQFDEHPIIHSIGPTLLAFAREWEDVFTRYVQKYPTASRRVDEELGKNNALRAFVEVCLPILICLHVTNMLVVSACQSQ